MSPDQVAPILLAAGLAMTALAWWDRWQRVTAVAAALLVALVAGASAHALLVENAAVEGRWGQAIVLALTAAVAVASGGPVTTQLFRLVDSQGAGPHAGPGSVRQAGTILRGGALIGALERAGVYGSLVAGWPEGLAVVLAVKGLGRYPELRNEDESGVAERFIIGTFSSVLWAVVCAGLAQLLR